MTNTLSAKRSLRWLVSERQRILHSKSCRSATSLQVVVQHHPRYNVHLLKRPCSHASGIFTSDTLRRLRKISLHHDNGSVSDPIPSSSIPTKSELQKRTSQWSEGVWLPTHAAQGRYLLNAWIDSYPHDPTTWKTCTQILYKFIEQLNSSASWDISSDLLEMTHRVLHGWSTIQQKSNPNDAADAATTCLSLLNEMEQAALTSNDISTRPGNKAYSMTLYALAAGRPDHPTTCDTAQALLERRLSHKHNDQPVDTALWNACLHVFSKCSRYDAAAAGRAEALLAQIPHPDVQSLASVLHAWAQSGQKGAAERAQTILEHSLVQPSMPTPNEVCWNICIDAWAKSSSDQPDAAERAEHLLRRMHQLGETDEFLQPSSVSFSTSISAWAKSGQRDAALRAERLLERTQELSTFHGNSTAARVHPTTESVSAVLDAWSKSSLPNAAQRAEKLLQQMERGQFPPPSVVSYTSVLHALANASSQDANAPERAEKILTRMEQLSQAGRTELMPSVVVYSVVADAWSKSFRKDAPDRALALFQRMEGVGIRPNTIFYNTVISCCAHHGQTEKAESLLEQMEQDADPGVAPNTISYAAVLNAHAKSGDVHSGERARAILLRMEELHRQGNEFVRPNTVAYTSAIAAFANSIHTNAGENAEALLRHMEKQHQAGNEEVKPNAVTVAAVMSVWASSLEAKAPERIQALLNWMVEHNLSPTRNCYNYLLMAWAKSRHPQAVRCIREILDKMELSERAMQPDVHSYNHLLDAIRISSDHDKATQCDLLLRRMTQSFEEGNEAVRPNRRSIHILLDACRRTQESREEQKRAIIIVQYVFESLEKENQTVQPTTLTHQLLLSACRALTDVDDGNLLGRIAAKCESLGDVNEDKAQDIQARQWIKTG